MYGVSGTVNDCIRNNTKWKVKAHRLIWLVKLVKSEDTKCCGQQTSTFIRSEVIRKGGRLAMEWLDSIAVNENF